LRIREWESAQNNQEGGERTRGDHRFRVYLILVSGQR
jgi:hypothetical protein